MKSFMEKINNDPALKEKWEGILKKHEATRDREAALAELSALAEEEGFAATAEGIFGASAPKGELSEEELESVSGGGSGLALCLYKSWGKPYVYKVGDSYEGACQIYNFPVLCNFAACRCWNTSHCTNGRHKCDENGTSLYFHSLTT